MALSPALRWVEVDLPDLIDYKGDYQQHQAGKGRDDHDEVQRDGHYPGHAEGDQAGYSWLDQEGYGGAQHDSPKEVA